MKDQDEGRGTVTGDDEGTPGTGTTGIFATRRWIEVRPRTAPGFLRDVRHGQTPPGDEVGLAFVLALRYFSWLQLVRRLRLCEAHKATNGTARNEQKIMVQLLKGGIDAVGFCVRNDDVLLRLLHKKSDGPASVRREACRILLFVPSAESCTVQPLDVAWEKEGVFGHAIRRKDRHGE